MKVLKHEHIEFLNEELALFESYIEHLNIGDFNRGSTRLWKFFHKGGAAEEFLALRVLYENIFDHSNGQTEIVNSTWEAYDIVLDECDCFFRRSYGSSSLYFIKIVINKSAHYYYLEDPWHTGVNGIVIYPICAESFCKFIQGEDISFEELFFIGYDTMGDFGKFLINNIDKIKLTNSNTFCSYLAVILPYE